MANDPNPLEGRLDHHRGRHQPTKEESSSSNLPTTRPFRAYQEASSEARNAPTGTNQPAEQSRVVALKPKCTEIVLEVGAPEKKVRTWSRGEKMLLDHSQGSRWTGT